LHALRALLRDLDKASPDSALHCAKTALVADGICVDMGNCAFTITSASSGCQLWASRCSQRFLSQCSLCGFLACESGQVVLDCLEGKQKWEQFEQRTRMMIDLLALCMEPLKWAMEGTCASAAPAAAHPFSAIDHGLPMIWEIISGPIAVLVPVVMWCCNTLPKVSGKKAKEGQEGLLAARQGLRSLLNAIQSALGDIHIGLAIDKSSFSQLQQECLDSTSSAIGRLEIPGYKECRQRILVAVADGQFKQLLGARQVIGDRLALVKSKSTFKA